MREYKAVGEFQLGGQGLVLSVILEDDIPNRDDILKYLGPEVKIDGTVYKVRAVDSFARMFLNKGETIGILV